jgi:hypothetical protein
VRRNPKVDRWFTERHHPMEAAMQRAREIILDADDRVGETVKWQTPTFVFEGNIASFTPAKSFVSLMFHRGAEIPGSHPRLDGDGEFARTMRFKDLAAVEEGRTDLQEVIRAWCEWKSR